MRRYVAMIAHDKFSALADATPEDVYAWRPTEGVRSVGEVFRHVAADDYSVPSLMGIAPPADTGVTADELDRSMMLGQSIAVFTSWRVGAARG